jgi:hypothetical protein
MPLTVSVNLQGVYPLLKFDVFLNNMYVGSQTNGNTSYTFTPSSVGSLQAINELRVVGYDSVYNSNEALLTFNSN